METTTLELYYSSLGGDADLAEIVELFVDEMPDRVAFIRDCYQADNWNELGRAAHQLKGAAGSYGFHQLTAPAAGLESAVREHQGPEAIAQAIKVLENACGRVRAGVAV